MSEPTPVAADLNATVPELQARAAADYAHAQAAARAKQDEGERQGILTGGDH